MMTMRGHFQRGRVPAGMHLPAAEAKKVAQIKDRTTLERFGDVEAKPTVVKQPGKPAEGGGRATSSTPIDDLRKEAERQAKVDESKGKTPIETDEVDVPNDQPDGDESKPEEPKDQPDGDEPKPEEPKQPIPDDLTAIDGIGEATEQKLYEAGITTYTALAESDINDIVEKIGGSAKSIKSWVKSAKKLAK